MEDKLEKGQWRTLRNVGTALADKKAAKVIALDGGICTARHANGETETLDAYVVKAITRPCGRLESLKHEYADNTLVKFNENPYHLPYGFTAVKAGDRSFSFANDSNSIDGKATLDQLVGMIEAALREYRRKQPTEKAPVGVSDAFSQHVAAHKSTLAEINYAAIQRAVRDLMPKSAEPDAYTLKLRVEALERDKRFLQDRVKHFCELAESRGAELERIRVVKDNTGAAPNGRFSFHAPPATQSVDILTGQIRILNQTVKAIETDRQKLADDLAVANRKNADLSRVVADPQKSRQRCVDDVAHVLGLSSGMSWGSMLIEVGKIVSKLKKLENIVKGS